MPAETAIKPASPPTVESGWSRLESPELFSFEKSGETFAGVLTNVTMIDLKGKRVPQYLVSRDQKVIKMLGTYDLVQKLTRRWIGCQVRITYLGEDASVSRNGNNMKVFDVQVKGSPSDGQHPSAPFIATDEDIPF